MDTCTIAAPDAITAFTEAEIFYGIELLAKGKRREELLAAAEAMFAEDLAGRVLAFDSLAARAFSSIAAHRRGLGRPIAHADAQIAAITQARRARLTTRNIADFTDGEVDLIDPWSTSQSRLDRNIRIRLAIGEKARPEPIHRLQYRLQSRRRPSIPLIGLRRLRYFYPVLLFTIPLLTTIGETGPPSPVPGRRMLLIGCSLLFYGFSPLFWRRQPEIPIWETLFCIESLTVHFAQRVSFF